MNEHFEIVKELADKNLKVTPQLVMRNLKIEYHVALELCIKIWLMRWKLGRKYKEEYENSLV
jgi:hypothetical protein